MYERLQKLKKDITEFVRDYDISDFYVNIDDGININGLSNPQKGKTVQIEIRY